MPCYWILCCLGQLVYILISFKKPYILWQLIFTPLSIQSFFLVFVFVPKLNFVQNLQYTKQTIQKAQLGRQISSGRPQSTAHLAFPQVQVALEATGKSKQVTSRCSMTICRIYGGFNRSWSFLGSQQYDSHYVISIRKSGLIYFNLQCLF